MKLALLVFTLLATLLSTIAARADFTEEYPDLKKYKYEEPDTGVFLGFGLSPLTILNAKAGLALSFFQVHGVSEYLDIELFNAAYGQTLSSEAASTIRHFTFRTSPKFRIF